VTAATQWSGIALSLTADAKNAPEFGIALPQIVAKGEA
jgi:hypothetical protein